MSRLVAIAISVQLALSAFGWAVGSGLVDAEKLPLFVNRFMLFGGPATFLMLGPKFQSLYVVALGVLIVMFGVVALVAGGTRVKKWLFGCALLWWLTCGLAAAGVGA